MRLLATKVTRQGVGQGDRLKPVPLSHGVNNYYPYSTALLFIRINSNLSK